MQHETASFAPSQPSGGEPPSPEQLAAYQRSRDLLIECLDEQLELLESRDLDFQLDDAALEELHALLNGDDEDEADQVSLAHSALLKLETHPLLRC